MTLPVIAIVQCGARKRPTRCPACELYTGPLFMACSKAAKRVADQWYIASALHGLVDPRDMLSPYNTTLPAKGDPVWGERVRAAIQARHPQGYSRLIALCSTRYLLGWADELKAETPLKGLKLGFAIQAANNIRRDR